MFHHSHDPKEIIFFPYVYPYVGLAASMKNRDHGLPRQEIQYLNWGLSSGQMFKRLGDAVRGWSKRRAARRALYDMDDRMLDDIGLNRGDIETAIGSPSFGLLSGLKIAVTAWVERGRARRALYAMDERMLADIGITRSDIESVVNNRYDGPNAAKPAMPAMPEAPVAEIHSLAEGKPELTPTPVHLDEGRMHAA